MTTLPSTRSLLDPGATLLIGGRSWLPMALMRFFAWSDMVLIDIQRIRQSEKRDRIQTIRYERWDDVRCQLWSCLFYFNAEACPVVQLELDQGREFIWGSPLVAKELPPVKVEPWGESTGAEARGRRGTGTVLRSSFRTTASRGYPVLQLLKSRTSIRYQQWPHR